MVGGCGQRPVVVMADLEWRQLVLVKRLNAGDEFRHIELPDSESDLIGIRTGRDQMPSVGGNRQRVAIVFLHDLEKSRGVGSRGSHLLGAGVR
jgi:hypothetical protein